MQNSYSQRRHPLKATDAIIIQLTSQHLGAAYENRT